MPWESNKYISGIGLIIGHLTDQLRQKCSHIYGDVKDAENQVRSINRVLGNIKKRENTRKSRYIQ